MSEYNGKYQEEYYKLKRMAEELGPWNIHIRELARKWDIPKSSLHNMYNKILKELPLFDLEKTGTNIDTCLVSNIKLLQRELRDSSTTKRDRAQLIRAHNDTIKTYIDFAERFGKKEKVAEKIEVNGYLAEAERIKRMVRKKK